MRGARGQRDVRQVPPLKIASHSGAPDTHTHTDSRVEFTGLLIPPAPSTISDLACCKEVEAMVTASQDSTVKVWEADWQIRMVFVGHTGVRCPGGSCSTFPPPRAPPSPLKNFGPAFLRGLHPGPTTCPL